MATSLSGKDAAVLFLSPISGSPSPVVRGLSLLTGQVHGLSEGLVHTLYGKFGIDRR